MSVTAAIPIQLQLTTRSSPPVQPLDINTNSFPRFWRGEDVDVNVGIFDPMGFAVDMANIAFLSLDFFPYATPPREVPSNETYAPYTLLPYPSTPPAPLLSRTLLGTDLTAQISRAGWLEGREQQAVFSLSWIDTLAFALGGKKSARFWFALHGITTGGRKLVYGGGPVDVYESGAQGVYLPNLIAPLDVPESTILYIQPNQQLTFSATIAVEGTIEIEGQLIQV